MGDLMIVRPNIGRRGVVAGLAATGAAFAAGSLPALAQEGAIPVPKGPVILTISGNITVHNSGSSVAFDMATLESLPQTSFTTGNPWTPPTAFSGVLFTTLLQRVGGHGKTAVSYALNDYVVEIPLEGMSDDGPLLATRMNGQYMPVAHYGPLFVMYNFAKHHEWLQNSMYARCIWQLQRMVIT
jgi:hypothetical protein